jgi:hypothetical protein
LGYIIDERTDKNKKNNDESLTDSSVYYNQQIEEQKRKEEELRQQQISNYNLFIKQITATWQVVGNGFMSDFNYIAETAVAKNFNEARSRVSKLKINLENERENIKSIKASDPYVEQENYITFGFDGAAYSGLEAVKQLSSMVNTLEQAINTNNGPMIDIAQGYLDMAKKSNEMRVKLIKATAPLLEDLQKDVDQRFGQ